MSMNHKMQALSFTICEEDRPVVKPVLDPLGEHRRAVEVERQRREVRERIDEGARKAAEEEHKKRKENDK